MKKLYPNLLHGLHTMLIQVFYKNKSPKKVFREVVLKNRKWGKRDRDFLAEHFYTIIRYFRKYRYLTDQEKNQFKETDFWKILKIHFFLRHYELSSFFSKDDSDIYSLVLSSLNSLPFPIEQSYPDWFYEKIITFYGKEKGEKELIALNQSPLPVLRVNRIKSSKEEVCKILEHYQIPYQLPSQYPDAIILQKHVRVDRLPIYHKGWVEIQDTGSQAITLFCPVKSGDVVIDACAGAGGKSLHLASIMDNQGEIYACDIHPSLLKELEERKQRAGATIIRSRLLSQSDIFFELPDADLVLIDAPCSGSGTLKRHPELKWRWRPEDISKLTQTQFYLLKNYGQKVKSEGYLVYATCSLFPEENQYLIQEFLQRCDFFEKEDERTIFPSEGGDGFYVCRLKRKRLP